MKKAARYPEKLIFATFLAATVVFTIHATYFYSVLQLHFYAILFQSTISFCVFILALNSRKLAETSFLCFLGTAFLFTGLIDLGHMFSLKTNASILAVIDKASLLPLKALSAEGEEMMNQAAQLWILARFIESVSFAISFSFLRRKVDFPKYFIVYAVMVSVFLLSVFEWRIFPECFNKIDGFTTVKNAAHLVTASIYILSILILYRMKPHMDKKMFPLMAAALVLSGVAEFAFSWNLSYYNITRPPAHIFKCISFYFIYKAIITTGFSSPIELLFKDLKQSEKTLARERDKLFTILDILPGFVFIQTKEHTISYANKIFIDLFGAVGNRRCHDIFLNCNSPCDRCPATRVLETGVPAAFEWHAPNGKVFIIHHGFFLDSDATPKVLASGIEITDRVSTRVALEETKERYRILYEHTPVMLHSIDETGTILNVSNHWMKMLGYKKEEIIGRNFEEFLTPKSRNYRETVVQPYLLKTGYNREVLYQLKKKDNSVMDIELSVYAEKNDQGNMQRSLAVSIDVTEKLRALRALENAHEELEQRVLERTTELKQKTKELEQEIRERTATEGALRASEQQYGLLVENSLTGIYIKQDGKILFANERFCEIHGYRHEEIVGIDSWRLVHPYDRALVEAYSRKRLESNENLDGYEARGLTKSGNVIWVARNNTRIYYRDKPAILGNLVDISLRKKIEAELQHSEKELKLLSARLLNAQENERKRIALELHDTIAQNLVTVKFTLGQKLKQMNSPPPGTGVIIEDIINLVQQNISEVRRIMTDLRPSILDDLGILATISWHCREFQKIYNHIHVRRDIDLEENDVPEELKIVIFRILQEAMSNAAKHSNADQIQLSLTRQNDTLELMIRDNGQGFDFHDVLSRINPDKGLGLVGMRERTEQSFGSFSIQSKENQGSRVHARWRIGIDGVLVSWSPPPGESNNNSRVL